MKQVFTFNLQEKHYQFFFKIIIILFFLSFAQHSCQTANICTSGANQSLRFCASGILNAHIQTVQICHRKYLSCASLTEWATAKLVS